MSKNILKEIDKLQEEIKNISPLSTHESSQLKEYFKIELTYSSNALEGNTLTLTETKIVIEDKTACAGKPLIDHLEAIGHSEAFNYMYSLTSNKTISQDDIKKLHYLFYHHIDDTQAGIYRKEQNFISGTKYIPPKHNDVPKLMDAFEKNIKKWKNNYHPIECASLIHKTLADIHPFIDGNGRIARLLMNTSLLQDGYPIAIIPPTNKNEYINTLLQSQTEDKNIKPFMEFIQLTVLESQKDYLRMLRQIKS